MILGNYSFGTGDRFGRQGKALLAAIIKARQEGVSITPVWNKSHREHSIIGTKPADTRREADEAVRACGWDGAYFVDADHIGLNTVDRFIKSSDFFTLDVADFIARTAGESELNSFIRKHAKYIGRVLIEGIDAGFNIPEERIRAIAGKFLPAVKQAGEIYRHIEAAKGAGNFVIEISMDETSEAQTPVELFFVIAAIADEGIPMQTIAPKFVGRFNKGVDYEGSVAKFAKQFEEDLAVVAFARREFGLPGDLKLSIHSGSDKFSIYPAINRALKKFDAGLHIKTSGTTWLEELAGLAMAGGEGLAIAKRVYASALSRIDELCQPYATVISIDRAKLPAVQEVERWDGERFAAALRHNRSATRMADKSCKDYNPSFRQLLHIAYKIAAEMGRRYLDAVDTYEDIIAKNVTENIYERHVRPIFLE
jgi:hypothetical protein